MDPFSITAGVLTILGACSTGIKALKSACASPQEYTRLEIELDHLQDVIGDVDRLVTKHQLIGDALIKNLTLAENKLQEVNNFIHESLCRSGRSPIKRMTLARHKDRVVMFAKDIETVKAHITDSLLLYNLIDIASQRGTNDTWMDRTQSAGFPSRNSLPNHLFQIHRELGEHRAQILQLAQKSAVSEANDGKLLPAGSRVTEVSDDTASDASDIYDDCVSHFSEDQSGTLVDRLRTQFTSRVSPDDFFDNPFTFVGEQYTVETMLGEPAAVVAMTETHCSSIHRLQRYFLIYAEAPRLWRKVTVSATMLRSSQYLVDSEVAAPDLIFSTYKTLPGNLQTQLQGLLKNLTLLETVTRISLIIAEHSPGNYTIDRPSVVISEDLEESYTTNEKEMLQDIEHMNVPQYLQSEVIIRERVDAQTYVAQVESRTCIERKFPFSGAGLPGDDGCQRFWRDLKLAKSLYECDGVVQYVGVVLDDNRAHVKSVLQELPPLGTIRSILAQAELREEQVPWPVRATWARQVITAVAEIHSKGFVVGMLHINFAGVRSDGSAVLNLRRRGYKNSINREGEIAPESRTVPMHNPQPRELDFHSDIFMLGMFLWQLAEHRSNVAGYLCLRNACTSVPRHSCRAEHTNPVGLPPCIDKEVPEVFNLVISLCRQVDPKKRPPARKLLQYLGEKGQPSELANLLLKYANTHDHTVHCDECGIGVASDTWYHCNVCYLGDFDLCSCCVSQGIHCCDKEHRLVKRYIKKGSITNVI